MSNQSCFSNLLFQDFFLWPLLSVIILDCSAEARKTDLQKSEKKTEQTKKHKLLLRGTSWVLGGPPQAKSRLYKTGRGDPWTEHKFGESMKAWRWLPEIQGGRLDAKVVPFQIEDSHLDIHCKSLMLFSSAPALCWGANDHDVATGVSTAETTAARHVHCP